MGVEGTVKRFLSKDKEKLVQLLLPLSEFGGRKDLRDPGVG